MLEQILHVTHPVMQAMLELWDKYRNKTLVDLSSIRYYYNIPPLQDLRSLV